MSGASAAASKLSRYEELYVGGGGGSCCIACRYSSMATELGRLAAVALGRLASTAGEASDAPLLLDRGPRQGVAALRSAMQQGALSIPLADGPLVAGRGWSPLRVDHGVA